MTTKNLKDLSNRLLGKFTDTLGNPISGRITPPADLALELESLKNLTGGSLLSSANQTLAYDFLLEDKYYIALAFKLSDDELDDLVAKSESTINTAQTPGSIYLYLAEQLSLKPIIQDPMWTEEYIGGPANSDSGVDLEILRENLGPMTIFSISDASIFELPTSAKYIANYISTFDSKLVGKSKLSQQSLEIIREIFMKDREDLVESNLFSAMTTTIPRHSFLEIYRTLEFVFVLPRASALLNLLKASGNQIGTSVLEFSRLCYKELGWKRVERDSLIKLFREFATFDLSTFEKLANVCGPFLTLGALKKSTEAEKIIFVDKTAEIYYRLRNQVVHQFWEDEQINCSDADWYELSEFTLACVAYFYKKHLTKTK